MEANLFFSLNDDNQPQRAEHGIESASDGDGDGNGDEFEKRERGKKLISANVGTKCQKKTKKRFELFFYIFKFCSQKKRSSATKYATQICIRHL